MLGFVTCPIVHLFFKRCNKVQAVGLKLVENLLRWIGMDWDWLRICWDKLRWIEVPVKQEEKQKCRQGGEIGREKQRNQRKACQLWMSSNQLRRVEKGTMELGWDLDLTSVGRLAPWRGGVLTRSRRGRRGEEMRDTVAPEHQQYLQMGMDGFRWIQMGSR